jgi:periplasmic mercuric ion binding protein
MKGLEMKALTSFLAGVWLAGGTGWAAEQQARIEVSELSCPSCPYIAADAVKSIESVEIIRGEYDQAAEKMVLLVSYDDVLTTPDAIAGAPMQYGYPGRVLALVPDS